MLSMIEIRRRRLRRRKIRAATMENDFNWRA
jgi:hypothetical protein